MSITDELREHVWQHATNNDELRAIADRIDAEHEKALDEQFKALTIDMKPMTDENMAEHGWVHLPKDADGEYIRVGDVMEFSAFEIEKPVTRMVDGIGQGVFFAWCRERGYQQHEAKRYRHYHAPTVEDVMYESLKHFGAVEERTPEVEEWLHEQAKRLTLAGDAE